MIPQYGKLIWEDVRDADKDRVVILNVSATEDHGPHMPLDTDTVLGMAVANGVADLASDEVFVMPPVPYGFNEHHKDFPGGIAHAGEFEAAMYLHLEPEHVNLKKAVSQTCTTRTAGFSTSTSCVAGARRC